MIFEFLQIFFEIVTRPSIESSYTRSLYKTLSMLVSNPWSLFSLLSLLEPLECDDSRLNELGRLR